MTYTLTNCCILSRNLAGCHVSFNGGVKLLIDFSGHSYKHRKQNGNDIVKSEDNSHIYYKIKRCYTSKLTLNTFVNEKCIIYRCL